MLLFMVQVVLPAKNVMITLKDDKWLHSREKEIEMKGKWMMECESSTNL